MNQLPVNILKKMINKVIFILFYHILILRKRLVYLYFDI